MKNKKVLVVFISIFLISVYFLVKYISFTNNYVSSDAVFVKSDTLTNLSFELSGKIDKITNEGIKFKKGDILAKLDTIKLQLKKDKLLDDIKALNEKIESLKLQKQKLQEDIKTKLKLNQNELMQLKNRKSSFEYEIKSLEIKANKLNKDYIRYKRLFKLHKISNEKLESAKTAYLSLLATINAKKEQLKVLALNQNTLNYQKELILNNQEEIKRLDKIISLNIANLNGLQKETSLINQNIKDSFIIAPFNGIVAKRFSNFDEVISKGKPVLTIVNLNDIYVLDLLEEKKLKAIKKGCKVTIHIDATNKDYKGFVDKILPASASTFSLVPRDIASGEFTKLQQRFYVRIKFDKLPKDVKVGMSGEVEIQKCKIEK